MEVFERQHVVPMVRFHLFGSFDPNELTGGTMIKIFRKPKWIIFPLLTLALWISPLFAHCDAEDGPVVIDANRALVSGKVESVLKWVPVEDEPTIKEIFSKVMEMRKLSSDAKEVAETFFLETLVRLHRQGEGAPYTGIKPAGQLSHIEQAADNAIMAGDLEPILNHLSQDLKKGLETRFRRVKEFHQDRETSPAGGRAYVQAYVEFLHYTTHVFDVIQSKKSLTRNPERQLHLNGGCEAE